MLSRLLTLREQVILTGLAISIFLGAAMLYLQESRQPVRDPLTPDRVAGGVTAEEGIFAPPQVAAEADVPPASSLPNTNHVPVQTTPSMPASGTTSEPRASESPGSMEPPGKIGVAVMGAVQRPGFYWMDPNQRVLDLLEAAGGVLDEADTSRINQAAYLLDGATLTVPTLPRQERADGVLRLRRGTIRGTNNPSAYLVDGVGVDRTQQFYAPDAAPMPSGHPDSPHTAGSMPAASASGLVSLNRGTQAELESLPGIGPALAGRIIQHRNQRPFQHVEELVEVSGIGPQRLEAVRDLVTVY